MQTEAESWKRRRPMCGEQVGSGRASPRSGPCTLPISRLYVGSSATSRVHLVPKPACRQQGGLALEGLTRPK